ncbi:MAG: ParA family protein [Clostridia bacterium]|nr:ParA family protein [Clostridia bacterium]
MHIITVSNQKGGVAKTTTAYCLASGLQRRGYRVLGIDLDPQANFSVICRAEIEQAPTIYELLAGEEGAGVEQVIQHLTFDVIPANILLSGADQRFIQPAREFMLKEILEPIQDRYDYIILDTPPSLGYLTINAYTSSTDIIIPTLAESLPLRGIQQLYSTVLAIQKRLNPSLKIRGILFTQYDTRTAISRAMHDLGNQASQIIHAPVFESYIRSTVRVKESQAMQQDLYEYSPDATAAQDYEHFIDELLAAFQADEA